MLVPAEKIRTGSLADTPAGYLLLSSSRRSTLFWIIDAANGAYAMFLNTEYARHAFDVRGAENWKGIAIGPVELRVDPTSANDGRGNTDTHLKASTGALWVPMIANVQGFNETVRLNVAAISTMPNDAVYFSRWALGMASEAPGPWLELVSFSEGDIVSKIVTSGDEDRGD